MSVKLSITEQLSRMKGRTRPWRIGYWASKELLDVASCPISTSPSAAENEAACERGLLDPKLTAVGSTKDGCMPRDGMRGHLPSGSSVNTRHVLA